MCGGYLRGEAQVVEGKSEEEIALEREAAEAIMRGKWGGGDLDYLKYMYTLLLFYSQLLFFVWDDIDNLDH